MLPPAGVGRAAGMRGLVVEFSTPRPRCRAFRVPGTAIGATWVDGEVANADRQRVRPEFEPSALTRATLSLRWASASIEGHLLSQARRQCLKRSWDGGANVGNRPIIQRVNISPTNSIVLCRSVRARLGAHHLKCEIAMRYRAGAYDLTVAHISPQRGTLYLATTCAVAACAGETKAAIALGVRAAVFTCIDSQVTIRIRRFGWRTIRADDIAAQSRLPLVHSTDIAGGNSWRRGERKALREADAVSLQDITFSVGNFVVSERRGPRAQSIRLIFEDNIMPW